MGSRVLQATVPSQQIAFARPGSTAPAIRWVFPSSRWQLSLLQAQRFLFSRDDVTPGPENVS